MERSSVVEILEKHRKTAERVINKKFNEYLNVFSNFINNLLNAIIQNINSPKQAVKKTKKSSTSRLEIIQTIQDQHVNTIFSLTFMRDGRLVSSSYDGKVVLYELTTFQPDIIISNEGSYYEFQSMYTICGLRNGNLACSCKHLIYIWEINGKKFKKIYTLEHVNFVLKIIELEDGKICSCSYKEIKIWDNKRNYQCIQILLEHRHWVNSVLETNNYILSAGNEDETILNIWNKSTYQFVKVIKGIHCVGNNGLSKLSDETVIIGGDSELYTVDILSFETKSYKSEKFGRVESVCVLSKEKVLVGNNLGTIIWFSLLLNQIILSSKVHDDIIFCLIKSEDNKLFSGSKDKTINIYNSF